MPPHGPPRPGPWLLAGGLAGLALLRPAGRVRTAIGRRLAGAGRATDGVAAFTEAPCYAHDRAAAGAADRTGRAG